MCIIIGSFKYISYLFWGDESWRDTVYTTQRSLFGDPEKLDNPAIVQAYCRKLKDVAGFAAVSDPLPMRNSKNAILYYLILASQKPVASSIINDIFKKYRPSWR